MPQLWCHEHAKKMPWMSWTWCSNAVMSLTWCGSAHAANWLPMNAPNGTNDDPARYSYNTIQYNIILHKSQQYYRSKHKWHINGLVQARYNSTANALQLHLSCINPSMCNSQKTPIFVPLTTSYVLAIVRILEMIHHVIKRGLTGLGIPDILLQW